MKRFLLINIVLFCFLLTASAQSKKDLEDQRKKTLEEITYVDNLLKETEKEKNESLNELKIIGKKLNLRESVLKGLQDEIMLINGRIDLNTLAIEMMESDLTILKTGLRESRYKFIQGFKGKFGDRLYIVGK